MFSDTLLKGTLAVTTQTSPQGHVLTLKSELKYNSEVLVLEYLYFLLLYASISFSVTFTLLLSLTILVTSYFAELVYKYKM